MSARRELDPPSSARLDEYGQRARARHLAPLWEFFKEWFGREPAVGAVPYRWRYDDLKPLLREASNVITAEQAERRVLALENPGLAGRGLATDSLYAGLQLIAPGEIAPAHRHTPAALRFIVEGRGAYTAVDGHRAYMEPGDFIVTPSWTWHDHGNETDQPVVWMDVLDVALLRFLGAQFSEPYPEKRFPEAESALRLDDGMERSASSTTAPAFSYPYMETRDALETLAASGSLDTCHGIKKEYLNRASGEPAIPTLSTFMQLLPAGFETAPYRSTASTVYSVVEGAGRVVIGAGSSAVSFDYRPRDILAVPSWQPLLIEADTESVIFSASDRVVQQKLGVWREQRD